MCLPPEIRNWIYGYAIPQDIFFFLPGGHEDDISELCQPSLMRVNSVVRNETLPIFFGCNTLELYIMGGCDLPGEEPGRESDYWLSDPSISCLERLNGRIDLLRNICTNPLDVIVKGAEFSVALGFRRNVTQTPHYQVHVPWIMSLDLSKNSLQVAARSCIESCIQPLFNDRRGTFDFSAKSLDELLAAFAVKIDHDNMVDGKE